MLDKAAMGKFVVIAAVGVGVIVFIGNGFSKESFGLAAIITIVILVVGFLGRYLFWRE